MFNRSEYRKGFKVAQTTFQAISLTSFAVAGWIAYGIHTGYYNSTLINTYHILAVAVVEGVFALMGGIVWEHLA